jgi:predicted GH43/DUF377 family glycosyl hydrolase
MLRDKEGGPHYLIWGDDHLTLAKSDDLVTFENLPGEPFLSTRPDHFDSSLVESGPPPLVLFDGNYIFFYNSAQPHPSDKPGYALQYNVGYLIINGTDPTHIIQRSEVPILTPTLAWETGSGSELGLTPNVVFLEAAKSLGAGKFLVFYGGADSVIGTATVQVKYNRFAEEHEVEQDTTTFLQ